MNIFEAIFLGLIQGLTEFLPVSSSGHLVLFQRIMGLTDMLLFDVILHAGTLAAVAAVFWKDIRECIKHPLGKKTLALAVATVPAVLIAVFFNDFIEETFSGGYLGFGFLITAVLLFITGRPQRTRPAAVENRARNGREAGALAYAGNGGGISFKSALVIGLFQGAAMLPGISRSGATMSGGLFCGLDKGKAANFSFLMSVPIIAAGAVYKLTDLGAVTQSVQIWPMITGFLAAAASGFLAIKFMLSLIKKSKLWYFAIYLSALGAFVLLNEYVFMLF